jgi:DNA excision repair protein ERCC-8
MQSLVLERSIGSVTPLEFACALTETFYHNIRQVTSNFPSNCHGNGAVNGLAIDNDYRFLLSGCADSSIKLWDTQSDEDSEDTTRAELGESNSETVTTTSNTTSLVATIPRKTAHQFGVSSIEWWPFDTGMFVSGSFDHTIKVWDTNELSVVHSFDIDHRVYSINVGGNKATGGCLVAVGSDHPYIRLLDLRSASSSHTLAGHKGKTLVVKWHPQNPNILASGGYDGEVKVWDIRRSQSCLYRLDMLQTNTQFEGHNLTKASVKAHLGPVNGLVWSETGATLYSGGNDDKIRVWDMDEKFTRPINKLINFGPLTRNKYPQTIPIMLNPNYETEIQYLLFPSDNSDVYVFRTIDGKLITRLSRQGPKKVGRTASMAYAGPFTGTYYCGTMDGEILTWSPHYHKPDIEELMELTQDIIPKLHRTTDEIAQSRNALISDPFGLRE